MSIPNSERAAFIVGVSGYMDLVPDDGAVLDRFRLLLHWLRNGRKQTNPSQRPITFNDPNNRNAAPATSNAGSLDSRIADGVDLVERLLTELVPTDDGHLRRAYRRALREWQGLGPESPIIVLCNLAPGVDTLIANLVLDEFRDRNVELRCPLPFPPHLYLGATTFVRSGNGHSEESNLRRQRDFLNVLVKMGLIDRGCLELARGTEVLNPELENALRAVPPELVFPVRVRDDFGLSSKELERKWIEDRQLECRRDRRYGAAGEYLASTAHLMVAVWNGRRDGSYSGTSAVVEARLAGPRMGLLPMTSDVPMPHGGPTLHLKAAKSGVPLCPKASALPPLRILHPPAMATPFEANDEIVGNHQQSDMHLQTERIRAFSRVGESIHSFNSQKFSNPGDAHDRARVFGELTNEMPMPTEGKGQKWGELLRKVSNTFCRASDLSAYYQSRVKSTLAWLFWGTFFAAVSLHLLAHWHPQSIVASVESTDHISTESTSLNGVQMIAGWTAFVLTAACLGWFAIQRARKLEMHGYDARAIAEGLRVQFFWNLVGLGRSVPANYLTRHRRELDWIRSVIRATSTPYEMFSQLFTSLTPETRLQAIRACHIHWVKQQLAYFQTTTHREHHRLHIWHKFGIVVALAGLYLFLKVLSRESWPALAWWIERIARIDVVIVLVLGAAAFSAFRETFFQRPHASESGVKPRIFGELRTRFRHALSESQSIWRRRNPENMGGAMIARWAWFSSWLRACGPLLLEVTNVLVPSSTAASISRVGFWNRIAFGIANSLAFLPLVIVVGWLAGSVADYLSEVTVFVPAERSLNLIFASTMLLVGALGVAWAEKNLHSEHAYQYSTMAGLFEAADRQLEKLVNSYESAISTQDVAGQGECLSQIHSLLFSLGREALEENAEWLILHRARPLELVMAG